MVSWMDTDSKRENESNNLNKFIRCPECGEEIMMVPTLTEMIESIENHISNHREHPLGERTTDNIKAPCIRENLTEQVLIRAAELRDPKNSSVIGLQ